MKLPSTLALALVWSHGMVEHFVRKPVGFGQSDFAEVRELQFEAVDDEEKGGENGAKIGGLEALFMNNVTEENDERRWNGTWQLRPMNDGSKVATGRWMRRLRCVWSPRWQ